MNSIDILLLAVILLAAWAGWRKGFILGSVNLAVWLGSLVAGLLLYKFPGSLLQNTFPSLGIWSLPLAFLLTLIVARILLAWIFNQILDRTPFQAHEHEANHAFGIIPGIVNGLIYDTILAALLLSVPLTNGIAESTRNSRIASRLATGVEWLDERLSPIFSPVVQKTMARMTIEPGSNETVRLHFTVDNAKERPDLEAKMFQLVNEERIKRGIPPLKPDTALKHVALEHSDDMFKRGYFSHYTLEGKDPFDRMHKAGIHFLTAGENLALGQTLQICHDGLMHSPGHRANILNPAFGRVGIGIMDGGFHGLMISQEFRN